jgi:hypothetical protein
MSQKVDGVHYANGTPEFFALMSMSHAKNNAIKDQYGSYQKWQAAGSPKITHRFSKYGGMNEAAKRYRESGRKALMQRIPLLAPRLGEMAKRELEGGSGAPERWEFKRNEAGIEVKVPVTEPKVDTSGGKVDTSGGESTSINDAGGTPGTGNESKTMEGKITYDPNTGEKLINGKPAQQEPAGVTGYDPEGKIKAKYMKKYGNLDKYNEAKNTYLDKASPADQTGAGADGKAATQQPDPNKVDAVQRQNRKTQIKSQRAGFAGNRRYHPFTGRGA